MCTYLEIGSDGRTLDSLDIVCWIKAILIVLVGRKMCEKLEVLSDVRPDIIRLRHQFVEERN